MRPEVRTGAAARGRGREQFPVGMRVLAVDDDPVCLKVLETLLLRCQYHVTTTNQAVIALKMLRENRDMFDLVISDVHMPDMDGFKLLELVGLEMDLPVIMLSVNGETKTVMKGITHGACDYLLKPVRIEELRNIWQHVVRRKFSTRDRAIPDAYEEYNKTLNADSDYVQGQVMCGSPDQSGRPSKKRKEYHIHSEDEDDGEESNAQENDDPSAPKKPRVVWSVELHRKFVAAVNHLGIDKAVPKRILEIMNVDKLTRENIASHLQKYRLYLKRLSVVASQQASIVAAFGDRESFLRMGAYEELQGYPSSSALSSFSPHGLINSSRNNPTTFGIQGVAASRSTQATSGNCTMNHSIGDPNKYHISLPGNEQGNMSQGLGTSLGQARIQEKWVHEDTNELSTILSGNTLANGMSGILQSVSSSPLLPQELMERTQAKGGIQPSIRASSVSSEHFESTIGVSSSLLESRVSQQSPLPLSGFSTSGFLMHGSFENNNATKLGATSSASTPICSSNDLMVTGQTKAKMGASSFGSTILVSSDTEQKYLNFGGGNSYRQKMDERNTDSLLDSKLVWSSSPNSRDIGDHHLMSQLSSYGSINSSLGARMMGQTNASASTVASQANIDVLISGDMLVPKNVSGSDLRKMQSELNSSSCSFDGLLNSIIKVENDESFNDDLGCSDLFSLSACR